jgi:hypothetical protein
MEVALAFERLLLLSPLMLTLSCVPVSLPFSLLRRGETGQRA